MLLIPAIDLKDGKCVRLRQGNMDEATVFSDDPLATARRWVEAGARRLHIVDLDGAFRGAPVNAAAIRRIAAQYPELPIQVGGGIRCCADVARYLNAGVRYVIIGTQAVREPHFVRELCARFPRQVMLGLDAKDGQVATDGWAKLSPHNAVDLAQRCAADGIAAIIYTDIARDGMMQGVNIAATQRLAEAVDIPLIAAGGIHHIDEIRKLAEISASGIIGAISGRALYEGALDFAAGQRAADEIVAGGAI